MTVFLSRAFPSSLASIFISPLSLTAPPPLLTSLPFLLPVSQESNSRWKGTTRWFSSFFWSAFSPHHLKTFFFLCYTFMVTSCIYWCHFVFLIFNCVLWLFGSLCVCLKNHRLSAFSGALVLVLKKRKKTKSQSRAVTVKCCRSRCDLDLEHRNNNCTFSIFIFAFFFLHHVWFLVFWVDTFPPAFQVVFREKKKKKKKTIGLEQL